MIKSFNTLDYVYFHLAGAGNTAYATVVTSKRTYTQTLTAAASTSIQFVQPESVRRIYISSKCAAAGTIEVSRVSSSQIANATGTQDVIARFDVEPVTTSGLPQQNYVVDLT
jgi:type IV secretory pathway VirB9-like protein